MIHVSSQGEMGVCKILNGVMLCTETLTYETQRPKVEIAFGFLSNLRILRASEKKNITL